MTDVSIRTCNLCNETKSIDQFEKDSRCKGNRTNRCRECKKTKNNKAYKAFCRLKERYPKFGVEIEITKECVEQIFDAFDSSCCYCGVEESEETGTFHLEHIKPLSKGGRNHVSNLVISCRACNFRKHDKPVLTYYHENFRIDYDFMPFLVKYIAHFSGRSVGDVEAELIEEHRKYVQHRGEVTSG